MVCTSQKAFCGAFFNFGGSQMKVEFIKLSSGEEIISQTEHSGDTIALKSPVMLAITREGVGMMPFAPFAKDGKISLSRSHVLAIAEPDDEIKNAYNSKFGSGIVVAPAKLSLGK